MADMQADINFACTVFLYGERLQAACRRPLVCMHYVMDLVDREPHASSNHLRLCTCMHGFNVIQQP